MMIFVQLTLFAFNLQAFNIIISISMQKQQHQNDKMEIQIENLLKGFYNVALHNHKQKSNKMQTLKLYLERVRSIQKDNAQTSIFKGLIQHESHTTLGDGDTFQIPSRGPFIFSSNMLYTNFISNYSNHSLCGNQNNSQVNIRHSFASNSIYKILTYALFINFGQINKVVQSVNHQENVMHSYQLAKQTIDTFKKAMLRTSILYKPKHRKKYVKFCYLYNQLLYYIDKNIDFKQDYIRVIVQQFLHEELRDTFENLQHQESELIYSRSNVYSSIFEEDFLRMIMLEEINRNLKCLNAKLSFFDGRNLEENHFNDKFLNIVVVQLPNGAYRLKEIITYRIAQQDQ